MNDPNANALGSNDLGQLAEGSITYSGRRVLGDDAGIAYAGYADYQFLDQESNKLPYRVGTYLGKKRVFNIGAGFFSHPNGTVRIENGEPQGQDVNLIAFDVYYDAPLGEGGLNAYATYQNYDYGDNYNLGTTYGTGDTFYGQLGYLIPEFTDRGRFMPYVTYSTRDYDAFANAGNTIQVGANWFINGHNAKLTLEFSSTLPNYSGPEPDRINGLVLQTHIFL